LRVLLRGRRERWRGRGSECGGCLDLEDVAPSKESEQVEVDVLSFFRRMHSLEFPFLRSVVLSQLTDVLYTIFLKYSVFFPDHTALKECGQCTERHIIQFRRHSTSYIYTPLPHIIALSQRLRLLLQIHSPPILILPSHLQAKSNPNPFIQLLYLPTKSIHASCGSFDVENSMHSSRAAFSSLHTQQGLGFVVALPSVGPEGLFEAARLLTRESESEAVGG
jgi:hypothetical protein